MKRKIDLVEEEEHESEHEESESSGDESEDEEPRIKDVLSQQCRKSVLLICCIVWPRPKIFFSGPPADNYFEINALFPSQTSLS